jgi:hypothetical protein
MDGLAIVGTIFGGIAATATIIGGVAWAVGVDGEVKALKLVTSVQLADIVSRLERIERKQDAQNGHGKD